MATRYATTQLNGFPTWLEDVAEADPAAVDAVLGEELSKELDEAAVVQQPLMTLQNIKHSSQSVIACFLPRLNAALDDAGRVGNQDPSAAAARLADIIELLLKHGDTTVTDRIATLAGKGLDASTEGPIPRVWLSALIRLSPEAGIARLENILDGPHGSTPNDGLKWIASLFGDRYDRPIINLNSDAFSPALLLRLVRLAYRHVQPSDDIQHEGSYTPDTRDHAERGRNAVLSALLDAKGPEGWAAKLEMAADPLFAHFRDQAIAIAEERAAEEADSVAHAESWVRSLDRYLEAGPITRNDMFALLTDRLNDVDDLLLRDASPRAALALIQDETIMRREIARALLHSANHAYTVDQEAATADEKETDIRMRSTASDQQAVIELKIGGKDRSARELRATLKDQLITKYMAAEHSRSGCLLITIADDRTWQHPDTNESLDLTGLIKLLNEEAARIIADMGGSLRLMAKGLDLRPRLATETARSGIAKGRSSS